LVLLAADGERNLPPHPGLTIVGDETSGYGIEKTNESMQRQKTCSQGLANVAGGLFQLGNLMPSYSTIFRWSEDTFSRFFMKV